MSRTMDIVDKGDPMNKISKVVAEMTPAQRQASVEQAKSVREYLLNLHDQTEAGCDAMEHIQLDVKPGVQTSLCTQEVMREVYHYDKKDLKGVYLDRPLCPEALVPYDESPLEGFAILTGMCADGERHKRFLHDLTKEVRHAAMEYLAPLPEEERPLVSKTDFLNAVAYPRKDRFRSPSPDYDQVPARRPIHHIALRRVIDRMHPPTPKRGGEDFRNLSEAPKTLKPSDKMDYRHGMDWNYSTSEEKVFEDPGEKSFTEFKIPTCFGFDQYKIPPYEGQYVHAAWPTPYLARSEDMNHAYQLIRFVIDYANKNKYSGELDLNYIKKLLSPRQLETVRRWVRLENGEWLEEDDNDILEVMSIFKSTGKLHQAVYIGQELCMLTDKNIDDRKDALLDAGRNMFSPWTKELNKWLMFHYKRNFNSPERYDIIYQKLREKNYFISRRSIIRQVERLLYEAKVLTAKPGTRDPYDKYLEEFIRQGEFRVVPKSHHWLHKLVEMWIEVNKDFRKKGMSGNFTTQIAVEYARKELGAEAEGVSDGDLDKLMTTARNRYKDIVNPGTGTLDYTAYENSMLLILKKTYGENYEKIARRMPRRSKSSLKEQWKRWQSSGGLKAEQFFADDHANEIMDELRTV